MQYTGCCQNDLFTSRARVALREDVHAVGVHLLLQRIHDLPSKKAVRLSLINPLFHTKFG
jgi:hypothetical protein